MQPTQFTRRSFLQTTAAAASALAFPAIVHSQTAGSDIRVAIVGFNGRGQSHISDLLKLNGVKITALCDVDDAVLGKGKAQLEKKGQTVETFTDVRKLLESKSIDAISTATPNHWHSLIGIWACQAGKDAYVPSDNSADAVVLRMVDMQTIARVALGKVTALVTSRRTAEEILRNLGLLPAAPRPVALAQAPPQLALSLA